MERKVTFAPAAQALQSRDSAQHLGGFRCSLQVNGKLLEREEVDLGLP